MTKEELHHILRQTEVAIEQLKDNEKKITLHLYQAKRQKEEIEKELKKINEMQPMSNGSRSG